MPRAHDAAPPCSSEAHQPVDGEFIRLAQEHHTIYCPTLTVIEGYDRLFESARSGRKPLVDDPNHCVDRDLLAWIASTPNAGRGKVAPARGLTPAARTERWRIMASNLKRVREAGIPIAMGTDAGNPLTLHGPSVYAEMEAMERAGLSAMDVLVASTQGGAFAMGRLAEVGTVEPGNAADLLVVGADPSVRIGNLRRVRYVVRGGVVRSLDELRPVTQALPAK